MASSPPLTPYHINGSCSLVPRCVLRHLNIDYKAVSMDTGPGGSSTNSRYEAVDGSLSHEQFLTINPSGYVPAIVVGEGPDATVITEMPAVLAYIGSLDPNQALLRKNQIDGAKVVEWTSWLSGTLHSLGFAALWRPGRFADDTDEQAMKLIKRRGKEVIQRVMGRIEERLQDREFAVGDGLTVVDFHLYLFWHWGTGASVQTTSVERLPAYAKLMRKAEALESVRETLEDEQIKLYFKD